MSRAANKSESVLGEVELARRFKRVTVPVFIEKVEPSKALLYYLSAAQWIEHYENPDAAVNQIVDALRRFDVAAID
jgi:hypothetical protein